MTRNNIVMITIPIVIATAIIVVWKFNNGELTTCSRREKVKQTVDTDISKDEMLIGVISEEGKVAFENAEYVTVEKVVRTTVEESDGKSNTNYDTYVVADLDIGNGQDVTVDYSNALLGKGFQDEKIESRTFEEAFDLAYTNKNGWELYEALLLKNGIDGSLDDVSFDTNTYEMTKQKLYVLNERCSVLNNMLDGVDYDNVLEAKVYYQIAENEEGVMIPDSFTAITKYKKGDQTATQSIFLQVAINHWESREEG
ncbi:MAG: hypothetical protein Q4F05_08415 [bacterium]|nr:hypothetical protein [bacterium]